MAVRRLNHAVLYVNGLERTVEFYRETLGFEVRTLIPGRAAFLRAPGSANDHDLGLFEIGTGDPRSPGLPRPVPPGLGGRHAGGPGGGQGQAAHGRRAGGGERPPGVQVAVRKDPSGVEFEVLWRVPAEDWGRADGDMTIPLDLDAAIAR